MTVTVNGDGYSQIDACDDTSGVWSVAEEVDSANYVEGSASLSFTMKNSGVNTNELSGLSLDLSGNTHLRCWIMVSSLGLLDSDANGGIRIGAGDATNMGWWYVGGSTTYQGGWLPLVVNCANSVDAGTKPSNMAAITRVGIAINQTGSGKNFDNVWVDNFHVNDGLIVYGDDGGGYFDFEDIVTGDAGKGICYKKGINYQLTGSLTIGDGSGSNSCKFQAKNQIVVFEDRPVSSTLYALDVVDNGTGTTEFILGDKSGTAGIQGCTIRAQSTSQSAKPTMDAKTDTDVDNFKLYASTFYGMGAISFAGDATNVEVISCTFEQCAQVDPNDCDTDGCFFINTSDADAALLWNESIDIASCQFIANTTGAGIEMPSAVGSPYDYNALTFSGNTYDVYNSSGSAISISKSNGSDPTSYEGSSVTFTSAAVTVQATITNADGDEIENALVYLQADAKSSGTATTDTADKLVDTNATFQTDGVAIGDTAFNQTDGTAALVTAVDSETSLSLNSDNFPDGNEAYRVGGPYPDQDTVTIVNSGTTATVTHTGHAMLNNDYVYIAGGSLDANRGVFQITYINANSYSYTMASTPGSSPTGTITSTFVGLFGLTNSSGVKSTSRVYASDQLLTGWARKSSSSPYYAQAPIRGTVDSSNGLSATGVLVPDE